MLIPKRSLQPSWRSGWQHSSAIGGMLMWSTSISSKRYSPWTTIPLAVSCRDVASTHRLPPGSEASWPSIHKTSQVGSSLLSTATPSSGLVDGPLLFEAICAMSTPFLLFVDDVKLAACRSEQLHLQKYPGCGWAWSLRWDFVLNPNKLARRLVGHATPTHSRLASNEED